MENTIFVDVKQMTRIKLWFDYRLENTILVATCSLARCRCGLIKDWKTRYSFNKLLYMASCCGLIKDWKTRYFPFCMFYWLSRCGLIKDWKTRYSPTITPTTFMRCGLIKDWKTRYYIIEPGLIKTVVVWLKIGKHDIKLHQK